MFTFWNNRSILHLDGYIYTYISLWWDIIIFLLSIVFSQNKSINCVEWSRKIRCSNKCRIGWKQNEKNETKNVKKKRKNAVKINLAFVSWKFMLWDKEKERKNSRFYWFTESCSFWMLWWAFDVCERSFIWLFRTLLICSADSNALHRMDWILKSSTLSLKYEQHKEKQERCTACEPT